MGRKLRCLWAIRNFDCFLITPDQDIDDNHEVVLLELRIGNSFAEFLVQEIADFRENIWTTGYSDNAIEVEDLLGFK